MEGEVVAVDSQGYPIPFQHLMRRFRRVHGIAGAAERIPLRLYLFDVLYLNGQNLISTSYVQRRQVLAANAGGIAYDFADGDGRCSRGGAVFEAGHGRGA